MAKASTKVETSVPVETPAPSAPALNIELLAALVSSTVAGNLMFVGPVAKPLVDAGLIEVNGEIPNPQNGNEFAARATPAGIEHMKGLGMTIENPAPVPAPAPAVAAKPTFEVITNATLPAVKRRAGERKSQFPFDTMEAGHSFFVPNSADRPDAAKSLNSTVSGANDKYATETGETRTVNRKNRKTGIVEAKVFPVKTYSREYVVRKVEGGKKYGEWTAPADGALVIRTK